MFLSGLMNLDCFSCECEISGKLRVILDIIRNSPEQISHYRVNLTVPITLSPAMYVTA